MKIKSLLFLCLFRIIGKHLLIETEDTAEAGQAGSNDPGKGCLPHGPSPRLPNRMMRTLSRCSILWALWKQPGNQPDQSLQRLREGADPGLFQQSNDTIDHYCWQKITKAHQAPCPLLPRSPPSAAAFKVWSSNILLFPAIRCALSAPPPMSTSASAALRLSKLGELDPIPQTGGIGQRLDVRFPKPLASGTWRETGCHENTLQEWEAWLRHLCPTRRWWRRRLIVLSLWFARSKPD